MSSLSTSAFDLSRYRLYFDRANKEKNTQAIEMNRKYEFKFAINKMDARPTGTILYSIYLEYSPKKDKVGIEITSEIRMLINDQKITFENILLVNRFGAKTKLFCNKIKKRDIVMNKIQMLLPKIDCK